LNAAKLSLASRALGPQPSFAAVKKVPLLPRNRRPNVASRAPPFAISSLKLHQITKNKSLSSDQINAPIHQVNAPIQKIVTAIPTTSNATIGAQGNLTVPPAESIAGSSELGGVM
jgi:hypothetical protein